MKHLIKFFLLLTVLMLLAACGGQTATQALPTVMPTDANAATATQPPTAAPTQPPLVRSTLPPTWTVSPVPTDDSTATLEAIQQSQLAKPTLVACGGFAVDREHSMNAFTLGSPVQVFWTAVDTAARYRVSLLDDTGQEVLLDYTREPTYTFRAELFEKDKRYAWSVYPEDSINQQMCFERGDDILPP